MEAVAIIRIVFFAVSIITMFIATKFFYDNNKALYILGGISIVSGIAFIVLLCTTNWTPYAIVKIISLIVILIALVIAADTGHWEAYVMSGVGCMVIIGLAFLVSLMVEGYKYEKNVHEVEQPKIVTTRQELLTANDGTQVSGNVSGGGFVIFHVTGSVSEESVYKYYYLLPDGGAKLGQVKADDTTIYYIENGESPYLEKIESTKYCMDYNNNPPTECDHSWHDTKITYKLHVPKGSISNVYEFDAG